MRTIRIGITVVLCFLSLIAIMKLLMLLNKGNVMLCTLAILGIIGLFSVIIQSKWFTINNKLKN